MTSFPLPRRLHGFAPIYSFSPHIQAHVPGSRYCAIFPSSLALRLSSMVFKVFLVRNFLDVQVYLANSSPTPPAFGSRSRSELIRIVGSVRFAETFRKFHFVLLSNALVLETADIQPNLVGWHHLRDFEPYFQGSHEKFVFGFGKLGAQNTLQFWTSLQRPPTNTWSIFSREIPLLEY